MKLIRAVVLALCLMAPALSLALPPEPVVVPGNPPITSESVNAHIRLIEFVLGVRLTTVQKDTFLGILKEDCAEMDENERKNFLGAQDLLSKLGTLDPDKLRTIRDEMIADYEEGAKDGDDAAAQLFLSIKNDGTKVLAQAGSFTMTLQAIEAFDEYLAFSRDPGIPAVLDDKAREQVRQGITEGFSGFATETSEALSGFDQRWHLIKAAWAKAAPEKKQEWTKAFVQPWGTASSAPVFDAKGIPAFVNLPLWTEISSFSMDLEESFDGWTATPSGLVW